MTIIIIMIKNSSEARIDLGRTRKYIRKISYEI